MNEQNKEDIDYFINILLLGDISVGKTSFIYNFIYDKFTMNEISSAELDLKTSDRIIEHKNIRVQLWDTVGQEKYKSVATNLILRAQGIIIVYDITNKDSYKNIKIWLDLVKENCDKKVPILIVGNKTDLEAQRVIKKEDAKNFCKKKNYKYVETSCLNGNNIRKSVTKICKIIISRQNIRKNISFSLSASSISENNKKHCC